MTAKFIFWKWSRSLSTLESDIENDYVSDEDYEEGEYNDEVFLDRYNDRIGEAQKDYAMFCDILNLTDWSLINWFLQHKITLYS